MKFLLPIALLSLLLAFSPSFSPAKAASGQAILTWEARNFFPADFAGKALPSPGTKITVAAEVARNGKLLDLSKASFSWYANQLMLSSGVGKKEFVFTAVKGDDQANFVRAVIKSGSDTWEAGISIPTVSPQAVVEVPFPGRKLPWASNVALAAVPYFFNTPSYANFDFSWQVGSDKKNAGNDNRLLLDLSTPDTNQTTMLSVNAYIQNKLIPLEIATEKLRLSVGQ